jgi:phosphohistidine phosphatase
LNNQYAKMGKSGMEFYLLRHGIAEDGRPGRPDAERQLTADGSRKLTSILERAQTAGVAPSVILTSPYVRARQTAELARKVLGTGCEIEETSSLEPDARPQAAWEAIRTYRSEKAVLASTHEPLASYLAAHLLDAPSLLVDFKKGALMRIDLDAFGPQPRGVLKWFLTARVAAAE